MPEYRFYIVNKDGHFAGRPTIHNLQDDDAAVRQAKRLLGDRPIEIWQGARKIANIGPDKN